MLRMWYLWEAALLEERRRNRRRRPRRRDTFRVRFPDLEFVACYGLSRALFEELCQDVVPLLPRERDHHGTDSTTKVLVALYFYSRGSYQASAGENFKLPMETLTQYLHEVTSAMNNQNIVSKYVRLPQNAAEQNVVKKKFYEKYNIPGVIGCIDGIHINIMKPIKNEHWFYHGRDLFSLKAQVACDSDRVIVNMDCAFGGSNKDAFIFGQSMLKVHLESLEMEETYLLGDAGYPLREYLLTPIAKAEENSPEAQYNTVHKHAYSTFEQTAQILRDRWRCISVGKELQFEPAIAAKIFIACCILHNMCVKAEMDGTPKSEVPQEDNAQPSTTKPVLKHPARLNIGEFKRGQLERQRVVQLLTGKKE